MKKYLLTLTLILNTITFAQYNPTSPYLINPDLAIGYTDSCANFWIQTWDNSIGGFFTNIDKFGNVITQWGTNKNMLTQSRNAYGMTRAYMLTGDTTYLHYAKIALDWMYLRAWDETYGGWFQELDVNGNPINQTANKTAFYQHYALLGIAAYYEATGDTTAWSWLMKGYQHLENFYWDERPGLEGYFDQTNYTNSTAWNKSFNATVDAITTHLLYLYLMTEEESYKERLLEIAEEIKIRFAASMPQQAIGFVEEFDSDWNWDNSATMTIMGHVLKAGWCLARINQLFPDTSNMSAAEYMINDVWQNGYDHEYGGPYKDFNRITGEMLLWGLQDSAKAWWQMEQAVVAGLQMYNQTGENWYLQMADETINFFMKFFVDHQNGEVYENRKRRGGFAWNEAKGNSGKAGYHSIETGYYTYLYGKLLYHFQPAILHYKFYSLPTDRDINLTPIAINNDALKISEILLDGQVYTDYDPVNRVLHLPSGFGGNFIVRYEPISTDINPDELVTVDGFELMQNYPNPFNPGTTIKYQLPDAVNVSLKIFNSLGEEVATLIDDEFQNTGSHSKLFIVNSTLPSGVYFYRLQAGNYSDTKKMILVK
ncbi:MAG: T9SS C-terminal target domain-containing protein [Chlorobiota bacterium]|nr:MAG: T9SS C-terminal target domain-containing protein [Chlorobiota bacterium]